MSPRALALVLLLAGCCTGPEAMLLAWEPRAKLERRETFALLATVMSGQAWAFADPASVASAVAGQYRPPGAGERVDPVTAAPEPLGRALGTARRQLESLGYRLAPEGSTRADMVVLVSLSTHPDGRLARVAYHVGGELDARFRPDLLGVAAVMRDVPDPCEVSAEDLVGALLELLPEREPPEDPGPAR